MSHSMRLHGGTDAQGAVRFDFSSNSNACGPCPAALAAVQAADATRYPDAHYQHLRQTLADFHGVQAWRIVLAASASEFIFRFTAWASQQGAQRVWIPPAAYGDYAHAAAAWRLQRTAQLQEADVVWACEPTSPLGQAHGDWPLQLVSGEGAQGQPAVPAGPNPHLVLDSAYAPLRLSGQPSLNAAQRDRTWQLFSPNKALGLTGVRAAYAVAPQGAQQAAMQLDALAPSWPVGAHGQAMLLAWTQPAAQEWLRQCLPTLAAWKLQQVALLQALGWQCLPSDANFFCARPPEPAALPALLQQLRAQGIKLRDATSLGLPGHVRVSAQPPEAQLALQAGLVAARKGRPALAPLLQSPMETSQ